MTSKTNVKEDNGIKTQGLTWLQGWPYVVGFFFNSLTYIPLKNVFCHIMGKAAHLKVNENISVHAGSFWCYVLIWQIWLLRNAQPDWHTEAEHWFLFWLFFICFSSLPPFPPPHIHTEACFTAWHFNLPRNKRSELRLCLAVENAYHTVLILPFYSYGKQSLPPSGRT